MATLTVGPNSTYPTIAAAMAAAVTGDVIDLQPGYSNETANVTVDNITVDGDASSHNIVLQMANGAATLTLTGQAPIDVLDNTADNTITGNAGDNAITSNQGIDTIDGGTGNDRLIADFSGSAAGLTLNLTNGTTDGNRGAIGNALNAHLVTFDNIENFTIITGDGPDVLTLGSGDDVVTVANGLDVVDMGAGNDRLIVDYSAHTDAITSNALLGTLGVGFSGGFTDQALIGPRRQRDLQWRGIFRHHHRQWQRQYRHRRRRRHHPHQCGRRHDQRRRRQRLHRRRRRRRQHRWRSRQRHGELRQFEPGVTVTVNGAASGGDAAWRRVTSIENIIGSGFADRSSATAAITSSQAAAATTSWSAARVITSRWRRGHWTTSPTIRRRLARS